MIQTDAAPINTPAAPLVGTGGKKTVALVGHPNVGKSVIFHALTGTYVTVSNFPGTTVDLTHGIGRFQNREWRVYDSPGVISLRPRTDDERVTRDLLTDMKPDVIVQVADAKNLGRALQLTLELSEFRRPVVLALNMMDEADDRGLHIDVKRLEYLLGIPVVPTVAITGEGIFELKSALERASDIKVKPRYDPQFAQAINDIEQPLREAGFECCRGLSVGLLLQNSFWPPFTGTLPKELKEQIESKVKAIRSKFVRSIDMLVFESKQQVINEILGEVLVSMKSKNKSWLHHLGNLSMRPFPGYFMAAAALFLLYEFVGVFGAGVLVNFFENTVFGIHLIPWASRLVTATIPIPLIQDALIGPYGIFTMALTYALALILPIVTTFFLFFSLMEDSGYLPRLAVMMDRLFRLIGLNGRAVLPMVLGLGCDTMATVTTRILETKKEKLIVSLLLTLAIPCSAQLGAILGMAAGLSWDVLVIWLMITGGTIMAVGWGAAQLLPGSRAPLLIEIPPLRRPKLVNIYKKVKARLKWYLKEVIPLFILATFVLFLLDKFHLLEKLITLCSPIVKSFLGLPAKSTEAFLIGFFRRDYGAAGFFNLAQSGLMSPRQVVVSMVVITLFMPCIAQVLITIKERGVRASLAILTFVMTFSILVGGAVNWILQSMSYL